MEKVLPDLMAWGTAIPQLLRLTAKRTAASAVFLRAVWLDFIPANACSKSLESWMSLMEAGSTQNLVAVRGI